MTLHRRQIFSVVSFGALLTLAFGSMPSEEEMAKDKAEKEALWQERKAQLAAVHGAVAAVDLRNVSAEACDVPTLAARIDEQVIKKEYGKVDLPHAQLSFLARFASDDPAAFTKEKGDFYWLTDMVFFTRFDDLKSDGTQPAESDWKWAIDELWEKRFMVVFVPDPGAQNVSPVARTEDDITWGELTAYAFLVGLDDATIHCQGRFTAESSDEIEWEEGAILSDGSAGEALHNDFARNVEQAVAPLVGKPLGIDISWWR
ncbi:MAG: hypothetical protein ABIO70_35165 [Pseudomonadota bacterium]